MADDGGFHYDETSVKPATYFAAISNLANAVMFSGMGEELIISPYERDDWLRRSGYVTRPAMPDIGIIGPVYKSSEPVFAVTPDYSDPSTLRWNISGFDRTLDPGAQAWTLLKITSPQFHLQFHELPENKIAALMMLPQARVQAGVLYERLRDRDGLFAARAPGGEFATPTARDQAAVLWASSSLILAGSSSRSDYWHRAFGDLTNADDYRPLADNARTAVNKLPAVRAADRGIAIEALGRYALAVRDDANRQKAVNLIADLAETLLIDAGSDLEDTALGIYGLVEAGRVLDDDRYTEAAAVRFQSTLIPLWNLNAGVFLDANGTADYTPTTVGAVIAALNAMRWYGEGEIAAQAAELYPRFFENAIIRSGLLQGSPLGLVSSTYLESQPAENFAHPLLANPEDTGIAPVFANRTVYENGAWSVINTSFQTSAAMFLANMLALKSDGRADTFLPDDLLANLR
jgi:hypothetical protein